MNDNTQQPQVAEQAPSAQKSTKGSYPIPRVWWGLALGIVFAVVVFIATFKENLLFAIVGAIFAYCFGASLTLAESAVREVIVWMATRSIAFPGLIWEFSLDGFLWLIGMKILFAIIGFLAGVVFAVLGVIIAAIISPISYPINLISYIRDPSEY
ncbi:MAG: hypothetical protein IKC72_01195 [Clostridia bacterium]|nr:hypothetical protein [Clostridia bacterium]